MFTRAARVVVGAFGGGRRLVPEGFRVLGLLTVMTGVMVACLVGLRKRNKEAVTEPA
jgi:hypothetical protein